MSLPHTVDMTVNDTDSINAPQRPFEILNGAVQNGVPADASAAPINLFDVRNRLIIITGGSQGLGMKFLKTLLLAGADVACFDIAEIPVQLQADMELQTYWKQGALAYYQCDITDEAAVEKILIQVENIAFARRRPVRGLVHCAGIQGPGDSLILPAEVFRRVVDVNLTGAFLVARLVARLMKKGRLGGSILLVASIAGFASNRGLYACAYNASKAGVHQLCRSLAAEWGRFGVRVNSLSPGYIGSAMTEKLLTDQPELRRNWMAGAAMGRLGHPDDLDGGVLFLMGDGSRYMTGADLRIDGGVASSI